jgi:hypothetical protein
MVAFGAPFLGNKMPPLKLCRIEGTLLVTNNAAFPLGG